jgi:hypothetical protein
MSNTTPVTLDAIRSALRDAAVDFLNRVGDVHPGETPYAFLFEISPSGFSAHGTVGTEEALTRFAERGIGKGYGDSVDSLRADFRWGSPEDAWYQQPDDAFDAVNALLGQAEEASLYQRYDGTLETLCLEVLKAMDTDGIFGTGAEREKIVLGLCYIGGDNSAQEFLGWAKQVNPPKVYKRLRKEYLG